MTDQTDALQTILTDLDEILRDRLKAAGLQVPHLLLAVSSGPEGALILRSNLDPVSLMEVAADLAEIATDALPAPEDGKPIH